MRLRALVFVTGAMALALACALPVFSAPGLDLNGIEFVGLALAAIPGTGWLRAVSLAGALSANVIVPLGAMLALTGHGRLIVSVLCAATLVPAVVLLWQALQSSVVTLHVGVAVWFVAMLLMVASALPWRA